MRLALIIPVVLLGIVAFGVFANSCTGSHTEQVRSYEFQYCRGISSCLRLQTNLDNPILAALNQSADLSVPATFRGGIDSGPSQKSKWVGTSPLGINDSPTAWRASCDAGLACQSLPGCPSDRPGPRRKT